MPYNRNFSGRGSDGRGRCRHIISERGSHNKIHNISFNFTTAKDSGGEQLKVFDFDNTLSNPEEKFNSGT